MDTAVQLSALGDDAFLLHLAGRRVHVDGGDLVDALALVAAVVDALRPACGLQRLVIVKQKGTRPYLICGNA